MGNRFSRAREANSAEAAAPEQKTAAEPAAKPAADSGITQVQEAIKTEVLEVVKEEPVAPVPCATQECLIDTKIADIPFATPHPAVPEPLVSVSEPEPVAEPKPVVEVQLAPEPAPEPVPEPEALPEPEPVPEPEALPEPVPVPEPEALPEPMPVPEPEALPEPEPVPEPEAFPEPIPESVPAPAEVLEQKIDLFSQESLPEPVFSSLPLIDLGVPDVTPEPIDIPPITATIDADEASDILVTEVCHNGVVESVEELMEVEAADNLEQLASDFNEESVSGLLKNLELKGNDLVADLIPNDVNIPGDMTISTELM
ncbi:magnetosome-associated protein MamJ-like [Trematomus bernacchii]|uniref:magnetosome-associated protein MamJ-like n=1 Tax=Trematomus bernacchii TaxID=40690 RepID=UPI00146D66DD|nr:magnetosome-associated protein MamJ-like [Trematomus bernacchii]